MSKNNTWSLIIFFRFLFAEDNKVLELGMLIRVPSVRTAMCILRYVSEQLQI
jgi:hypothetical protein